MSRIMRLLISAFLLTALLSAPVSALTDTSKIAKPLSAVAVTATAGGYLFASSQEQKSTPLYGLKFSYDYLGGSITDSIGLEATFNYFDTTSKATGKSSAGYLFRGDLIYLFVPRGTWVPYLAVGGGDLIVENTSGKDHSPLLNYGLGLRYFWEEWLALRVDARQLFVYEHVATRNNYELSAGLMYVFGKEHKKKSKAILPKAPLPNNIKAIPDIVEPEPEPVTPVPADAAEQFSTLEKLGAVGIPVVGVTPRTEPFLPVPRPPAPSNAPLPLAFQGAKKPAASTPPAAQPEAPLAEPTAPAPTRATPLPVPAPIPQPGEQAAPSEPSRAPAEPAEPAAPKAAPKTAPQAAPLAAVPAPVPAPPAPASAGEPAAEQADPLHPGKVKVVSYLTVEFDFSSSVVRPQYLKKLATVAGKIKAASQSATRIGGHTDNIGKARPNLVLSLQRAQNVKNELVKLGVDPKTITIVGYGFTRPKATNETSEGRKRNRRASAVITVVTYVDSPAAAPGPGSP